MALMRRIESARGAAHTAARLAVSGAALAAAPAVLTAGLLAEPARTAARLARTAAGTTAAVAEGSLHLAKKTAVAGTRTVGTLVTGADPIPDGHVRHLAGVARGMLEPPLARHTRRVWADHGRAQVEVAIPDAAEQPEVRRALRRHLERLEGVEWATVNDVVGRVLVGFDDRRVSVEDVVDVVTAIEQARGGKQVFPQCEDHPADLEPLIAAMVDVAIDTAAIGVAFAARAMHLPAVSRHATLAVALLDSQQWIKSGLESRIGPVGTDLVFTGMSALLHAMTQSPTIPAINAVVSLQDALEIRARRQVWRRRELELCRPEPEDDLTEPLAPPGARPVPLPSGPIENYAARLGPVSLGGALGLLPLTGRPGRSADLLKTLTPKAALNGRESFAATLDWLMCRRDVLPMHGSVYRRLDRIDAVVLDSATLCTGPPVVIDARADADGWDDAAVWTAAARLLGSADDGADERAVGDAAGRLRLGPPRSALDAPGGEVRTLLQGRRRVGVVTVAAELDTYAEPLVAAVADAGHRLVLTTHVGVRELSPAADEVAPEEETLLDTVRRLQATGHGVLLVSATDSPALMGADVGVAPVREDRSPAWGADLVTPPGLVHAWHVVAATVTARAVSRRSVGTGLTGNVLGALLAAVGSEQYGQRKATAPGKTAATVAIVAGVVSAVRFMQRPAPAPSVHTPWHALDADDVLRRLADLPDEPEQRRSRLPAPVRAVGGLPVVAVPARFLRTVVAELSDPLTPILGTGAAATALLGDSTDAVLVGSVTVGNALISGLQRLRAETALESLLLEQDITVHRETDGGREDVPGSVLRVGDVVQVEAGDVVSADARLLEVLDLEVDESNLTGESLSVCKSVEATPGAEVADRTCMLFDGTTVVAGSGRAVVVAVGPATQAGRAARAAGGAAPPAGVQARLGELTRAVLPLTLAGGGAVTALGVLWRRPLREAVRAGLAVSVAAVPEGLPLVATVAQQAAARRLSRRGAVVRSARVLEALGRVDTVCFDKTGTLTENRLRVARLLPLADGLDEDGLLRLAAAGVANGDAQAHETDRAVVEAAGERGADPDGDADSALPFAADRGFSAAVRNGRLVVKGAPEVVLRRCTDGADLQQRVQQLAGEGLRVLAVADRAVEGPLDDLDDVAEDLTLRGLVGLADTLRESSVAAVEQLRAAGVRIVVATGDHPETAGAIAARAGVPGAHTVVTGAQLARASDTERAEMVRTAAVFARLSPEQKVTLVAALRRAGATLAMTGDGVNDAAAIRLADVGVGVAGAESPAARTAADLVLTDVDLTRLVDAIAEGRAMWSRVRDAVSVLVGGNAGEVAFTVLGTAFGGRAPLGTRQLLLVNLLTDMFPALAVAVAAPRAAALEEAEGPLAGHRLAPVLLAGPQRGFTDTVRRMVLVRGAATTVGATGAWVTGRLTGTFAHASTMGLAALIATQLGQTAWAGRRSPLVLATAAGSVAVLVAVVQTPGLSRFFGCRPLDPLSWLVVLGWAVAGTVTAEVTPRLVDRVRSGRG